MTTLLCRNLVWLGVTAVTNLGASQTPAPATYDSALRHLSARDTARAIEELRAVTRSAPNFGPAFLRLGSLLSARSSVVQSDFQTRLEAERALERAERLLGADPEVLLELGLLRWKQGFRIDARRSLDRAWQTAVRRGDSLPPATRARLHYGLGRIYETWWEDWQYLIQFPPGATSELHCGQVPETLAGSDEEVAATLAVKCPEAWWTMVQNARSLSDLKSEERSRMVEHYRRAFEADSTMVDAAVRYLGYLADGDEWDPYDEVARQLVRSAPADARSWLFLGLGLHQRGVDAGADSAFSRALAVLPDSVARVFADITPLIPRSARATYATLDGMTKARTADAFFEAEDPLYLTTANERRLEHYTRLAWAELKFGVPEQKRRGWETERGNIWVRYGAPKNVTMCCYGAARIGNDARYVFWSYGPHGPVFTFQKPLAYRSARLTPAALQLAQGLEATTPESYQPRAVSVFRRVPSQIARFRGSAPNLTRVEIYAQAPAESLDVGPGDSLETGIFVFDAAYTPIWSKRVTVEAIEGQLQLNYAFTVPGGTFRYALEARRTGPDSVPRPAARSRDSIVVTPTWGPGLAISDLLLADTVGARVSVPVTRSDLQIEPNRTLTFTSRQAVHLYFELYGLTGDSSGVAHYRVELAVDDSVHANVVQRVLRGVVDLFRRQSGQAGPPSIAWDREVPAGRERSPDYVAVQLPELSAGAYVIRLRVTDKATGQIAAAERVFRVAAARTGP